MHWKVFAPQPILSVPEATMPELKTKKTEEKPADFIKRIEDPSRRKDCARLMKLMSDVTGSPAKIWGTSIIGFGDYKYKSGSKVNEWFLTGFAARKANITIYLMSGYSQYGDLMQKLGKHKTAGSCLHIKSLDDINMPVLGELIERSTTDFKKKYLSK
jgi:hypothetical protein